MEYVPFVSVFCFLFTCLGSSSLSSFSGSDSTCFSFFLFNNVLLVLATGVDSSSSSSLSSLAGALTLTLGLFSTFSVVFVCLPLVFLTTTSSSSDDSESWYFFKISSVFFFKSFFNLITLIYILNNDYYSGCSLI